jgi:predicted kinase
VVSSKYADFLLIGGLAGCGKTSLGRELARLTKFALYDKDTLTIPLVTSLLVALNSPFGADDRESDIYLRQVRPLEYGCLMDAVTESAGLGISTIAVAPFSKEMMDSDWRLNLQRKVGEHIRIHYLWLRASEEVMRRRLVERDSKRDTHKLANWRNYADKTRAICPLQPCLELDCSADGKIRRRAIEVADRVGLSRADN